MVASKEQKADDGGNSPAAGLVELGRLRGAYGLRGWVRVQPHADDGEVLRRTRRWWLMPPHAKAPPPEARGPLQVTSLREQGAGLVAKWRGCDDPETAEQFKGWTVAVPRAAFPRLPDGQYYWVDLIGARVVNRGGQCLGVVRGLRSNGAQDLLEVEREPAVDAAPNAILIPMVADYVDAVDLADRQILVDWELQW